MRYPKVSRVIRTIAVIVPLSIIYLLLSNYIWDYVDSVLNNEMLLVLVATVGAGVVVYLYKSIMERIWLRLSPPLFESTTSYTILASLPLLYAGLCGYHYQIQNLIISLVILVLSLLFVALGYYRYLRHKPLKAFDRALFLNESTDGKVELTRGQQVATKTLSTLLSDFIKYDDIGPLSIAVNGRWGDGKTTIVNKLLSDLDDAKIILVRFDPWRYTSQESLVSGFYDEIGRAIAAKLPGFKTARIDFAKFAKGFIATISKSETLASAISLGEPRMNDFPRKIDRHLRLNDMRLLVVIDDVERLYEDAHITRTLQLAQYLKSDITNSAIIFLTDIAQIESAIPKRLNGSIYLQKFFDTTIALSPPTRAEMLQFMNTFLQKLDIKVDVKLEEDIQLSRLMRNVRGIKRVLSMFANDIDAVGQNVKAQDVLFLRSLYYAYPSIYIDIRENSSMYFGYSFDYSDSEFSLYGFNEEEFEEAQKEHFDNLFAGMEFSPQEIKRYRALLEDFFPALENVFRRPGSGKRHMDYEKLLRERRIGSREYLDRYFILSEDVDKKHELEAKIDTFISDNWKKSDKERYELLKKFYDASAEDSKELFFELYLQKIRDLEDNDRKENSSMRKPHYRDLLRLNVEKTDHISMDGDGTFMRTLGQIDQHLVPDDFSYIFEDLVEYAPHPTISLRIALYMNPTRDNGLYYLRQYDGYNELRDQILRSVDSYYLVQGNNVLTEDATADKQWIFVVAQWSTSVCYNDLHSLDQQRFEKVNLYLVCLAKDNPDLLEKLIQGAFWANDLISNKYRYSFNTKPMAYDHNLLAREAKAWMQDKPDGLSEEQKRIFTSFLEAHDRFLIQQAEIATKTAEDS